MNGNDRNPLEILELSPNASKEEIIKQYKKLALKYHPDRNMRAEESERNSNENKFKEITCAYKFLEKNNFKYNGMFTDTSSSSFSFFSKNFMVNKTKISRLFTQLQNISLDNIADNILKEVNTIQNLYNQDNTDIEKSLDITINANIELIDIYNNVTKEVTLKCVKKCKKCMTLGYDINTKKKCTQCNGLKIIESEEIISFKSGIKNQQFKGMGNEELEKRPGDININIYPRKHDKFRIIDDYNIIYFKTLTIDDIKEDNSIYFRFEYLELKEIEITIYNPKSTTFHEYEINNKGLFTPKQYRGKLIIALLDPDKLIKKNNLEYSIKIKD